MHRDDGVCLTCGAELQGDICPLCRQEGAPTPAARSPLEKPLLAILTAAGMSLLGLTYFVAAKTPDLGWIRQVGSIFLFFGVYGIYLGLLRLLCALGLVQAKTAARLNFLGPSLANLFGRRR